MRRLRLTQRTRSYASVLLLILLPFQGCSDDDGNNPVDPGTTPPSQLQGLYFLGSEYGYIRVTIGTDDLVAHPSGALTLATTPAKAELTAHLTTGIMTIHGSYDPRHGTISLNSQGYTLNGTYDASTATISGMISNPLGRGFFVGGVDRMKSIDVYCGTFSSEGPPVSGQWKLAVIGNEILGSRAERLGESYAFSGTLSGGENDAIREVSVHHDLGNGMSLTAEGTLVTATQEMTGTYTLDDNSEKSEAGTWSSTPCHGGAPAEYKYTGTFMGAEEGGRIGITIDDAVLAGARVQPAASTGTHHVRASAVLTQDGGATSEVIGFFDHETNSLTLSGSGYTVTGAWDESLPYSGMIGQYQGPAGNGLFVCLWGSTTTVKVMCGTFQNANQTASGRLNFAMYGMDLVGLAASDDEKLWRLEGVATPTYPSSTIWTIQLSSSDGEGGTLTATGTLDATTNTVTGTWETSVNTDAVDSGTWSGSLCPGGAD